MVKITRNEYDIRIYINDILHLQILFHNHDGIQSWIEGTKNNSYFIEFYRKVGKPIYCQYDNKELWLQIINELDKII